MHRLFEEQAAARPDAAAVVWDGGALTYGELDRRAARVARRLRRLGAGVESRVAVCAERSAELVVALLGALKAGAAYLPLDPAYPRERLALLLADAAPAALVGPRRLLAAFPSLAPHLAIEDALVEVADGDADTDAAPVSVDVPPAALAYVLYTSGSTGAPKGVEVSHRAVVRLVREAGYASFGPGEVYLQLVPMSFDVATFELWGPLLNGGRLALLPPGPYTLADLYGAVARHGVTTLWLTSGVFHLAVEEGLAPLGGLRQLLAGGDVLSRPHVLRALAALPGVDLVNGYGPTENTTFSTTHRLRGGLAAGETSVPIGRPIAASRAYVLDRSLAPLPIACVGELYVGGAGVARGYLGRPALTAERFLPDPFGPDPFSVDPRGPRAGDRLYRTGDLARWRPDGTLDFLGRRDFQIKVRGFRVEPGEVESALLRHPGVREAVVTATTEAAGGAGGHRLVAYYVPEGADGPAPAELSAHLRESLPEHLVPSILVPLAELPLNANGKVDRRALPPPESSAGAGKENGGRAAVAPRGAPANPIEEVIAGIWAEVLGVPHALSVEESFFHLGGHSLLAIRMLSRLRAALGADLPVQQVFESPTIAGLAAAVARATASGDAAAGPALPPLAPRASRLRPRRSPTRSSGSGSSTAWRRGARPTTCPRPTASPGRSRRRRSPPPSPRWRAATGFSAPASSSAMASRGRRSRNLRRRGSCRWWISAPWLPNAGAPSWRACAPRRPSGRSTSPRDPSGAPGSSAWARATTPLSKTSTRSSSASITPSTTAGPRGCSSASSRRSMARRSWGRRRPWPSRPSSTPTSRPGSAPGRRRCSAASSPIGAGSSPARRRPSSCRRTGRARPSRASAAPAAGCSSGRRRRRASARRRGGRGRRSTCCSSRPSRRRWRATAARRTSSSARRSRTAPGRSSKG